MNPDRHSKKDNVSFVMRTRQLEYQLESTWENRHPTAFGSVNLAVMTLERAAQQDERKRIAQELHDTLLQGFTGVALKLDAFTHSLPPELSKPKAQLERILEQIDEHLAEARRSIWELRSATRESSGHFSDALARAGERALEGTPIPLVFSVLGAERKLPTALEDNLLRICEEAIANAVKHAHPTRIEVALEFKFAEVQLRVRDDGCGFDPAHREVAKSGHFGLLGIRERVEAFSGMLAIDSTPGRGTKLLVRIPTDRPTQGQGRRPLLMSAVRTASLH